jgi:hypothetical protein
MKTDKELAVELTIGFLASWNGRSGVTAATADDAIKFLKRSYDAISELKSLEDSSKEE